MKSGKTNVYYNTLLSVSQILYPLITFPYASRILGPDGIGLFSFVDSITQYFILIAAFGIPIYGIREVAKAAQNKGSQSKIYSELLIIHLGLTALLMVVYICSFLVIPTMKEHSEMFWIGTGILFFNVFPTEWFFQGMQNFVFVAKRTIIIRMLSIGALFIFVKEKDDVTAYYMINLFAFMLNAIINLWYARNFVKFSFRQVSIKKHISPLTYIFACNVAISIYLLMDSILLGFLVGNESVGFYTTSSRLSKVFILVVTAFSLVMIPRLSTLFKEDNKAEIQRLLKLSFEYVFFITVPICIGLFIVAEDFVRLYAGPEFLPAVTTVRIMSPLVFLIGLSNIFGMQILTPKGREKKLLVGVGCGMVVSIGLNLILIPLWKENGAAVTNITTEVVVTLVTGYYALREVKMDIPWKRLFQSLLSSLAFIPINYLIMGIDINYIVKLGLVISLCGITYIIFQYFVWKSNIIIQILNSVKRKLGYEGI
ncbi:oligosaccharide flippase family protein [Pedobacter antarcticus]|uniref:oligosaccharide flippase family protein n=1 Tax=Pedobacter antarcticus TaxID=34086 RepID=UPI001C590A5B|nr:flippase [Pedobacter antarcticus]